MLNTLFKKREGNVWRLIATLIAIVSFTVGCGDSNSFVATNTTPTGQPGTLTFNFVKAQTVQEVPQSTVTIQFDWLDANSGILRTDLEPFAASITLTPPAGMVGVRITPLSGDGFPLFSLQGPLTFPPDGTNLTVDYSGFTLTDITLNGITLTPDPVNVTVDNTQNTQQVTVTGSFSNGQNVAFPASALADVVFTPDGSGFFTVSSSGVVTGVAVGTGQLSASYTFADDGATTAVTDSVAVNVTGTLPGNVRAFTHPDTDTLTLPSGGFQFQTFVAFNGERVEAPGGAGYTFSSSDPHVATIDNNGLLTTGEDVGPTTITLTFDNEPVDSFVLTTGDILITDIDVTPGEFNLTPGRVTPYRVIATFNNGDTADIASSPIVVNDASDGVTFYRGRAVGSADFGEGDVVFSLDSFATGDPTDTVHVVQAAGFISNFEVRIGGLTSGRIPLGMQGAVDVFATLDDGEVLRLRPNQFNVSVDDETSFNLTSNNLIEATGDIGDATTFTVEIEGGFEPVGSLSLTLNDIDISIVSNTSGSATVAFTNYSDDNIMFVEIARPITVLFSNGAVTDFKVTDDNVTTFPSFAASRLRTYRDVWGFPCLDDGLSGFDGTITYNIETLDDQVLATADQDVRVFYVMPNGAPRFVPSSIVLNTGETRVVEVAIQAKTSFTTGSPQQFLRALDFAYNNNDIEVNDSPDDLDGNEIVFVRRGLGGCAVTATSFGYSQVEVFAREVNFEDGDIFDSFGEELTVTIPGPFEELD